MFDDNSGRLQKIEAYSQVTEIPDWMFYYNSGRLQQIEAYSQVTELPDWMFDDNSDWLQLHTRQVIFSGYGNTRLDVMTITVVN